MLDHKQLFGIAAIVMSCGFFVRSFQPAHAINGPNVSLGSNPHRSFFGQIPISSEEDLLTVSGDQVFVITSCYLQDSNFQDIKADANVILSGNIRLCESDYNSPFSSGNGRLIIESGSTLKISNNNTYTPKYYYIEGYFAPM